MQVYDKGMHSLLSVLFLLGEQKKKTQTKKTKQTTNPGHWVKQVDEDLSWM